MIMDSGPATPDSGSWTRDPGLAIRDYGLSGTNTPRWGLTRMLLAPFQRAVWIAAGLGALVLSGCGQQRATIAEPVEGVPLTQQRTIDRNELGYKWPFEMGTGTIACDGGALFFRTGGTTYALSRGAGTRGYADIDAIRRAQGSGPPSDPVSRLTQEERMKIFAQSSACTGDNPGKVTECKARIRARGSISESELTRIEAEGAERFWPPLTPPLMSLDAVSGAARQLCPH
jgi:hypothetical protein